MNATPEDNRASENAPPRQSSSRAFARGWIWLLPVIVIVWIFVVSRTQTNLNSAQMHQAVGQPAPQVSLMRLSNELGSQAGLDEQGLQAGKVTLIHFWGTWCPPCRREYPDLAKAVAELRRDDGFRFLSVSCEGGRGETVESLREKTNEYLDSIGVSNSSGDIYADPQEITRNSVAERMQQSAMYFPTSLLIDREGVIRGVWEGYTPEGVDQIQALAQQLLQQESSI